MQDTLESLFTTVVTALSAIGLVLAQGYSIVLNYLNNGNMSMMVYLLIAFILLSLVLVWRRWRPNLSVFKRDYPELLVSKGEIVQVQSSTIQTLHVKVSNLSEFPVQLLEFAVQTELMNTPITVEAVEVLDSHEAIELEATMPVNVVGEQGDLKLYVYVTYPRKKVFVLRSEFIYEPWNGRHKVSPLGQTIRPIRRLASSQLERLRKKAWLEQYNPQGRIETPARPESHQPSSRPPTPPLETSRLETPRLETPRLEVTQPKRPANFQVEPRQTQQRQEPPRTRTDKDTDFPNEF
jgi:hypothetical protein